MDYTPLLNAARSRAADSGQFASVALRDGVLECAARDAAAPAHYRLVVDGPRLWVALVTADRYLSQSIEQDLVHTGDKMEELFDEELNDVAHRLGLRTALTGHRSPRFEHFRDEHKLFTFRTPVLTDGLTPGAAADRACLYLLAFEQTFRPLGAMEESDDDA